MSFAEALIQSCDTVYYNLGYEMWQHDNPGANVVTSPKAPVQKMQQMALDWGFGKPTGIDLPDESTGTVPTREWLYYYWKDNAYTGQDWCKNGKADGSYVQQIEYQDCQDGNVWEPGQAAIAAIGQGYDLVTPLQLANAYVALANGGTLYPPRIGEALLSPSGAKTQKITPPVAGHLPVSRNTLAYIRNALAGVVTQGTAAGAFSGFPLNQVCVAGKTGTAEVMGKVATSVFASFAPCSNPQYVVVMMIPNSGFGADASAPAVRQIWDGIYGLEGHKAAVSGGQVPSSPPQILSTGQISPPKGYTRMSVGRPGTSYRVGAGGYGGAGGPRAGSFRTRPRSLVTRVTSRDSFLRHVDWALIAAVLALCVLGVLLVWSATEPTLAQQRRQHPELPGQAGDLSWCSGWSSWARSASSTTASSGSSRPSSTAWPFSACWWSSPRSARPSTAPPGGSTCPAASRSSRPSTPRSRSSC